MNNEELRTEIEQNLCTTEHCDYMDDLMKEQEEWELKNLDGDEIL